MSISAKKRIERVGINQSLEAIKKARESLKGKDPWNKGKKASEETRRKLSEAHLGQVSWNKGISTSDEVREKQKRAKLGISKPVHCPELDKTWSSIEEAARNVGISTMHIKRLIRSGRKSRATNFSFRFV